MRIWRLKNPKGGKSTEKCFILLHPSKNNKVHVE
jgi:hypothetical protein